MNGSSGQSLSAAGSAPSGTPIQVSTSGPLEVAISCVVLDVGVRFSGNGGEGDVPRVVEINYAYDRIEGGAVRHLRMVAM